MALEAASAVGGLVLAGGRSRRFGSEKAMALVRGAPMIAHVARALAAGCEEVAVNAPEGSGAAAWALSAGLTVLPDRAGDPDGPLSGVRAGLAWAAGRGWRGLVTCPCDTPGLPADAAARLAAALGGGACAYAVSDEGPHPLCAAWRTDDLARLEAALACGHPSVRRLLDGWGAVQVRFDDAAAFRNVNAPADLEAPIDAAGDGPRSGP